MTCYEVQQRLPIFLDGALDEADGTAMQAHLASCHRCRAEAEAMRSLESQLRTLFRAEPVPPLLWPRICASLAHHESTEATVVRKRAFLARFGWMAAAVFLLVIGVALFRTVLWSPARLEARLLSVPVQDLHTFVISQRPLDITSTDPQHLRRWFQERVDFAPPLLPVQAGRARLTGGRLCYFLERRVAAFMYTADGRYLALYVMPRRGLPRPRGGTVLAAQRATVHEVQGYTHLLWSYSDLLYSLVSDLPRTQLLALAQALMPPQE